MRKRALVGGLLTALAACLFLASSWTVADHARSSPSATGTCPPVQNSPFFTIAYGTVKIGGIDAPVGTVVGARSPRGDTVGCFVVSQAGSYGAMYVYGEDTSVTPPVPGMRNEEEVSFYVEDVLATADPPLTWAADRDLHQVALSAQGVVPPSTATPTLTATATPTASPTPTATPGAEIALQVGWNLISIPLSPSSTALGDVLASIEGKYDLVYAYDASDTDDQWKKYNVAAPPFLNDLTHMRPKYGYWIRVSQDCRWRLQ